jgi:lysozyme
MNINELREEIAADEGCKYEIYLDHLSLPTHGIGHLITEDDPEYGQPVGTPVSEDRVNQVFEDDISVTLRECRILFENFDDLPEDCQRILANMMFNMGRPRLSKFVGMKSGIYAKDWNRAADEMVDSKWYGQVTNRADRLVKRMRALADG